MKATYDHINESGYLISRLANHFLSLETGQKIRSIRSLSDETGSSIGSVSAAINELETQEAIHIQRRGRLGSILQEKHEGRLWKLAANGPFIIASTLPSFLKAEGLATGIFTCLDSAGVDIFFSFIRGSNNRLKALQSGRCNAAIISKLAADQLSGGDTEVVTVMPELSFVTDHLVFYRLATQGKRPLTVAMDTDSYDLTYITEQEFGQDGVEYQSIPFVQTDYHFGRSTVDAVVSNSDHVEKIMTPGIASRPLSPHVQAMLAGRDTMAAIVVRKGDFTTRSLIESTLNIPEVLALQEDVVKGRIVPRY